MRKCGVLISAIAFCLLATATAVSASEWEPEREYSSIAVDPADEMRYGGYNLDGTAFIDVLDRVGTVIMTSQVPTVEGLTTRLHDLASSGDLMVASYEVHGEDPFLDPHLFALSLYRDGEEIARGVWGGIPYAETSMVALNDETVFVDYADTGVPEGPFMFSVDDIPAAVAEVEEVSDFEPIPGSRDFDGDEYPGVAAISASNEYLYLYWNAEYLSRDASVDVYSLGSSNPEFDKTVSLSGLDTSDTEGSRRIWDADHGPDGSFVLSGTSASDVAWCSIWTHVSDGSLQDCFMARPGGAEKSTDGRIGPFDVDGCGGIVVADTEAEDGVLTGHKLIPSSRDPGCFVDSLDSTFASNIAAIGGSGITKGCNPPDNDRFCPGDFVTRGQMAAFLRRALDDVLSPTGQVEFVDDDGYTFEEDIEWLGGTGVTKGCNPPTNDRFCPDDFVTRGQMAAFLVRAMGYTDDRGGDRFVDDDGSTFERDIARLATAGLTKGCNPPTNDRFCPDDFVTRGQMAAFLDRALSG